MYVIWTGQCTSLTFVINARRKWLDQCIPKYIPQHVSDQEASEERTKERWRQEELIARRKKDGVRKSSLLRSGREKRELENGDGENKRARQQRRTRETIFIIRTGRV